ncbi:MAG: hypothetical protein JEY99_06160 [Spirochaetales bacterium]|nr:hypothetical protein [Spirochaetales bacterium]
MKSKNPPFSLLVLLFFLYSSLTGCSCPLNERAVHLVLPELPDSWESFHEVITFRIIYPGEDGKRRTLEGVLPGDEPVVIIPKQANYPILAQPCFTPSNIPSGGMRPAGGLYPEALNEQTFFRLTWADGFLAECMLEIGEKTGWETGINSSKLRRTILDVSSGDPWYIEKRKLLRPLLYGRFYGGFVSGASQYPVVIPGNISGSINEDFREEKFEWAIGDPLFNSGVHRLQNNGITTLLLHPGFHRLIGRGGGEWMDIYIDEEGEVALAVYAGATGQ